MRWPRLSRRHAGDAAASESSVAYQPGSWGQSTLPPVEPDRTSVPTGNVEVIAAPPPAPAAPPPQVLAPPVVGPPPTTTVPPPFKQPVAEPASAPQAAMPSAEPVVTPPVPVAAPPAAEQADDGSGVRLGFEDGSDLQLAPDHPHSLALKAVADILLHRGPHRRAG